MAGSLALSAPGGYQLTPQMGAIHTRRAEQELASASSPAGADEARTRLEFIRRHAGELLYDLPCHRGHYTLATAPQITRALRHAKELGQPERAVALVRQDDRKRGGTGETDG